MNDRDFITVRRFVISIENVQSEEQATHNAQRRARVWFFMHISIVEIRKTGNSVGRHHKNSMLKGVLYEKSLIRVIRTMCD